MLQYSKRSAIPFQLLVCDAQHIPLPAESFDILVASLGDPYNTPLFWSEAARLLRPNGHVIFTTPSFEWAIQFRSGKEVAEFILSDGRPVAVPSFIEPLEKQCSMINASGLGLIERQIFMDTRLRATATSPKLRPGPIVSGYLARK